MTSHLIFPYNWVDCSDSENCPEHVHLMYTADTLNNYPQEWAAALIGNCVITSENHSDAVIEKMAIRDTNGKLHYENGPAAIQYNHGDSETNYYRIATWYQHGERHRENGPAVIDSRGNRVWCINGKRHRTDGPAREYANGNKVWYINDERHRTDGPAVVYKKGRQEWWMNGQRHREDGPAIIDPDGTQEWYFNGKLHRVDGPAIIESNGREEWWVKGRKLVKRRTLKKLSWRLPDPEMFDKVT